MLLNYICSPSLILAQVAKLVDAPSSGGGAARCAGSNPVLGTTLESSGISELLFFLFPFLSFLSLLHILL